MARFNKAKNFTGKSYVVSTEVETLINSLTYDSEKKTFGFTATGIAGDTASFIGANTAFANWISGVKADVIGTAEDTFETNTILGAKKYAKKIVEDVSAAAISVKAGNGIKIEMDTQDATKNIISTDIKLVKSTESTDYAAVYKLMLAVPTEDGQTEQQYVPAGTIDIPRDMVATKGELVSADGDGKSGTFIKMTIANGNPFYINVASLIEYNSYEDSNTIIATETGEGTHTYSFSVKDASIVTEKLADSSVTTAKLADKNVTKAKLEDSVQTSLGKADTALQSGAGAKVIKYKEETSSSEEGGTTTTTVTVEDALDDIYEQIGEGGSVAGQIQAAIEKLDADVNASGTATKEGTFVVSGIKQADGKITEVVSVEVESAGAAAAVKDELLGSETDDAAGDATIAGANKAAAEVKTAFDGVAVKMVESSVVISQADAETPASVEFEGRLVSMYDASGAYVFADSVKYATGKTTVTIDFGGAHPAETFTVVVTKPIIVNA